MLDSAPTPDDKPTGNVFNPRMGKLKQLQMTVSQRYTTYLNGSIPLLWQRWVFAFVLITTYILRVYFVGGFYIVSYALAIYLLNLLIGFLTPKFEPDDSLNIDEEAGEEGPTLPTNNTEKEFKPFIRRLPEFQAWYNAVRAVLLALLATFFRSLDIPVFWPILVIYFLALFAITMRRQIAHMIKHRYIPFSVGKPKYKGKASEK